MQKQIASAPETNGGILKHLAPSIIQASPLNPRKSMDQAELADLVESVAEKGVIQPIKVRPLQMNGKKSATVLYELVYGERRWQAATKAKLKTIPVIVQELTDDEVLHEQLIENLQRADVHPLEEAEAFHRLADRYGLKNDTKELARRLGKSHEHVVRRLKLTELAPEVKKHYLANYLSEGHALELCRLTPEMQLKALPYCYRQQDHSYDRKSEEHIYKPQPESGMAGLRTLQEWINKYLVLDLSAAPWTMDRPELGGKPACAICPHRTGTNKALFADAEKDNLCTNPRCFWEKMNAFHQSKKAELENGGFKGRVAFVSLDRFLTVAERKQLPDGTLALHEYQLIEGKQMCESALKGIVVHRPSHVRGAQLGHVINVCTDRKCKDHMGRTEKTERAKDAKIDPKEASKRGQRKQDLFDARVAEPVRRRTLKAILERIGDKGETIFGSARVIHGVDYFRRMAYAHFKRIPSDTRDVMYEVLGWTDILSMKGDPWKLGDMKQKKADELITALDEPALFRFMVLCSIAHLGENLGRIYGPQDQTEIIKLAEQHNVPYQLFDARERHKQSPGRKYHSAHELYLLEVLLSKKNAKKPSVDPTKFKLGDDTRALSAVLELRKEVEKTVTPHIFHDGPWGICTQKAEDGCLLAKSVEATTPSKKSGAKKSAKKTTRK